MIGFVRVGLLAPPQPSAPTIVAVPRTMNATRCPIGCESTPGWASVPESPPEPPFLTATAIIAAMTQESSTPPLTLEAVQSHLLAAHGIEIRDLTGSHLRVSQSAAVATALNDFGHDLVAEDVSAFAVTATATNYGEDLQPDGTLRLRISDRAVWMV